MFTDISLWFFSLGKHSSLSLEEVRGAVRNTDKNNTIS